MGIFSVIMNVIRFVAKQKGIHFRKPSSQISYTQIAVQNNI